MAEVGLGKKRYMRLWMAAGALVLVALLVVGCMYFKGIEPSVVATGFVMDGKWCYMVEDNKPVMLHYNGPINFQTGDTILESTTVHLCKTSPAQTKAYFIMRLKRGTAENIPESIVKHIIFSKSFHPILPISLPDESPVSCGGLSFTGFAVSKFAFFYHTKAKFQSKEGAKCILRQEKGFLCGKFAW